MPSAPLPKGEIELVILRIINDLYDDLARFPGMPRTDIKSIESMYDDFHSTMMFEVEDTEIDKIEEMSINYYLSFFQAEEVELLFMILPSETTHKAYHNLMRLASHMILSTDGRTLFILNNFKNEATTQSLYALLTESVEQYQSTLSMARLFDCACDNNH